MFAEVGSVCDEPHGRTVHKHLIQCTRWKVLFLQAWAKNWDRWQNLAETWRGQALEEDMHLVSMLRIPSSFLKTIPLSKQKWLRERVS